MSAEIKILLVDDHPMLREGLAFILNSQADMQVTGEAGNLEESLAALEVQAADIAVIDYGLKGIMGNELTATLLKQYPELHVLGISSSNSKSSIKAMVEAGAKGFVLKDSDVKEVLEGVRATAEGRNFFSRDVSTILLDLLQPKPQMNKPRFICEPKDLTSREIDVMRCIVEENTNKEIANHLHISVKTVENHRQNLMQKIGARNTAGIVRFALHNKLAV